MACSYGGAGALWKIFARADVDALRAWLWDHLAQFEHHGQALDRNSIADPIHDQVLAVPGACFLLAAAMRIDEHGPGPACFWRQQINMTCLRSALHDGMH